MKLKNWSIRQNNDPYSAPELRETILVGDVYGHENQKRFYDGKCIQTSCIVNFNDGVVETNSGSLYELGEVDPEYEKMFPDALKRMGINV